MSEQNEHKGHRVEIWIDEKFASLGNVKSARGVRIQIDGKPIEYCSKAILMMDMDDVVRLRLEILPRDIIVKLHGVKVDIVEHLRKLADEDNQPADKSRDWICRKHITSMKGGVACPECEDEKP